MSVREDARTRGAGFGQWIADRPMNTKILLIIAVLACAGIGMFLSFIHGFLITRVNMQPFIVTLCGLLFYRGLARFIASSQRPGDAASSFQSSARLANSTASPTGVPVAWHSIRSTSDGRQPACR